MGLTSYVGHRMLAGFLILLGISFLLASSGRTWMMLVGIVILVAASYFFKTQH